MPYFIYACDILDTRRTELLIALTTLFTQSKNTQLIKQASLIGGLLFGSRALTETILVLGSSNGGDHIVSALIQAAIALACAGYFFLVK